MADLTAAAAAALSEKAVLALTVAVEVAAAGSWRAPTMVAAYGYALQCAHQRQACASA